MTTKTTANVAHTPKPSAVAPVSPEPSPRDMILKAIAVMHAHQGHMLPEDVKILQALTTTWRKVRKDVEQATLPKVGDTVKITKGSRLFIGKLAKVENVVNTRIVVTIDGTGGQRLLAASAVEKA
jgi:hypothetical protein